MRGGGGADRGMRSLAQRRQRGGVLVLGLGMAERAIHEGQLVGEIVPSFGSQTSACLGQCRCTEQGSARDQDDVVVFGSPPQCTFN
jgi:hypothetical protein